MDTRRIVAAHVLHDKSRKLFNLFSFVRSISRTRRHCARIIQIITMIIRRSHFPPKQPKTAVAKKMVTQRLIFDYSKGQHRNQALKYPARRGRPSPVPFTGKSSPPNPATFGEGYRRKCTMYQTADKSKNDPKRLSFYM